MLDVCPVRIGDFTLFGPAVQIYTPLHLFNAAQRRREEFGRPTRDWIGCVGRRRSDHSRWRQHRHPSRQLALNDKPAAKAYQEAMFTQGQAAAMFFTDDVQADYERMKARGAEFTMPPTDVTGSKIAMLNDTCGNLIQVTQLMRW